jgi:hypothetical protein
MTLIPVPAKKKFLYGQPFQPQPGNLIIQNERCLVTPIIGIMLRNGRKCRSYVEKLRIVEKSRNREMAKMSINRKNVEKSRNGENFDKSWKY